MYLPQQPEMVGERTHRLDYSQHGRVKKSGQLGRANTHQVCQDCFSWTLVVFCLFFSPKDRKKLELSWAIPKNLGVPQPSQKTNQRRVQNQSKTSPDLCFLIWIWYEYEFFPYSGMVCPRPFECGFKKNQHLRFSRRYAIQRCQKIQTGINYTIFYGNTRTVSLDETYTIFKCPQMIHMAKIKPLIAAT